MFLKAEPSRGRCCGFDESQAAHSGIGQDSELKLVGCFVKYVYTTIHVRNTCITCPGLLGSLVAGYCPGVGDIPLRGDYQGQGGPLSGTPMGSRLPLPI